MPIIQTENGAEVAIPSESVEVKLHAGYALVQGCRLPAGGGRGAGWSGAVMPRLDWRVTRERDVVTTLV